MAGALIHVSMDHVYYADGGTQIVTTGLAPILGSNRLTTMYLQARPGSRQQD